MSTLSFAPLSSRSTRQGLPLALAMERTLECVIRPNTSFRSPVLDLGCGDDYSPASCLETNWIPDRPRSHELRELPGRAPIESSFAATENESRSRRIVPKPCSPTVSWSTFPICACAERGLRILSPGGVFYFTVPTNDFETWTVINQLLIRAGLRGHLDRYRRLQPVLETLPRV